MDTNMRNPGDGPIRTNGGAHIEGKVEIKDGDFVGRDKKVYIDSATFGLEPIDWDKVDYAPHLKRVRELLMKHMCRFAGARSAKEALRRYLSLRVQERRMQLQEVSVNMGAGQAWTSRPELWFEKMPSPRTALLIGDAGSGKTTQLLFVAYQLAKQARQDEEAPLPIYFTLRSFLGGDLETLLAMAANAIGVEQRVLQALWREGRRALVLILDGADEVPASQVQAFASALVSLHWAAGSEHHALVVSARPGQAAEVLSRSDISFFELIMVSLNDTEIDDLLGRYGVPGLAESLQPRLREVLQNPDLLSALAQSLTGLTSVTMPRSTGQIYQLLVDQHLFGQDSGDYDYARVKRPILASLACKILTQDHNYLVQDDGLEEEIAERLEDLFQRYHRRRRVMPEDWSAQGLLEELAQSPVLERAPGQEEMLAFSKQGYGEFFTATHLASLGVHSPEVQRLLPTLAPETWIHPLINLMGIEPEAIQLFDILFESMPQLAADLWFDRRPEGIQAPRLIRSTYHAQGAEFATSPLAGFKEPVTGGLLVRMLNSNDPRQRLRAARALSQWGWDGVPALLDAAEDDQLLVSAVARHALLHLGEPEPGSHPERPMPPLLGVEQGLGFGFGSYGGCNARVGPLRLVEVPKGSAVELAVTLVSVDFDPFAVESEFAFWYTPPTWWAASWFVQRQKVDWTGLAARCQWIAAKSAAIARMADLRAALVDLAQEMHLRAARYDQFGTLLADTLGIAWQPVELADAHDWVEAEPSQTYEQLRYMYSRANRPRFLRQQISEEAVKVDVGQTVGTVAGRVIGVQIENINLALLSEGEPGGIPSPEFLSLEVAQTIDEISGSSTLFQVDNVVGGGQPMLPTRILEGAITVTNANGASIGGLEIASCRGGLGGLKAEIAMTIESFVSSQLYGIVVGAVSEETLPYDVRDEA